MRRIGGSGKEIRDESLQKKERIRVKAHEGGSVGEGEDGGRFTVGRWVSVVIMENGSVEEAASG